MKFVKNPSVQRAAYEQGRDTGLQGAGYHNPFEGSYVNGQKSAWAQGYLDGQELRAHGGSIELMWA